MSSFYRDVNISWPVVEWPTCCGADPCSSTVDVISRTCRHRPIAVQTFPTKTETALVIKWVRIGLRPNSPAGSRNAKRKGRSLSIQFHPLHFLPSPLAPSSPFPPFPLLLLPSLPGSGPFESSYIGSLGGRCKLPKRGPGQSYGRQSNVYII